MTPGEATNLSRWWERNREALVLYAGGLSATEWMLLDVQEDALSLSPYERATMLLYLLPFACLDLVVRGEVSFGSLAASVLQ